MSSISAFPKMRLPDSEASFFRIDPPVIRPIQMLAKLIRSKGGQVS